MTAHLPQVEQDKQNKINKLWSELIACISHDIKSPLVTMRASLQAVEMVLPDLINAYKIALEHKLVEPMKNEGRLQFIQNQAMTNMKSAVDYSFNYNKAIVAYVHALDVAPDEIPELSMKSCVDDVLKNYPFVRDSERALVHVDIQHDFKFKGIKIFIDDLLSNLLSNALRAIETAGKGEITIWTNVDTDRFELHFKDTGAGVALKHSGIFDRYTSKRNGETKAGLGFCRLALLLAQADISFDSVLGAYAHFILRFPK